MSANTLAKTHGSRQCWRVPTIPVKPSAGTPLKKKEKGKKRKVSNKTTRRLKCESQEWLTDSGSQTDALSTPPSTPLQNSWRKQWQNCGQCTRTHRTYSVATCPGCSFPLLRTYVIAHVSSRNYPPSYFATCPLRLPFLPYKFPSLPCVLSFNRPESLLQRSEKNIFIYFCRERERVLER